MSSKTRAEWEAWLAADPALRAAWDGFGATLAEIAGLLAEDPEPDTHELSKAARRVLDEAGEDKTRH